MKKTTQFAGIVGAAGILVGPFVTTAIAHADDSNTDETPDYGTESTGGDEEAAESGAPSLPVTRVVDKESSSQAMSASLGIVIVEDVMVPLEVLPEDVVSSLPQSGMISEDEYMAAIRALAPFAVADEDLVAEAQILSAGHHEIMVVLPDFGGEREWIVEAVRPEPGEGLAQHFVDDINKEVENGGVEEIPAPPKSDAANKADNTANSIPQASQDGVRSATGADTVVPNARLASLPVTGLPSTGAADTAGMLLAGVGLAAVGSGLLVANRKKRNM